MGTALPKYLKTFTERDVFGVRVLFGLLQITKKVTGYATKNLYSGVLVREDTLDKPIEYTYKTHGFVFKAPSIPKRVINPHLKKPPKQKSDPGTKPDFYADLSKELLSTGAYHALEHVLIEGSNMLTGGGSRELGGISVGKTGTIIVHDALPGGSGLSKLLYSRLEDALSRSYTILKHCSCKTIDGCPRCTYSYQCGNNNRPLFKDGALQGIKKILDNTPTQVEIKDYSIFDTFV
ncbi:MAG: Zn-binding domain-containing protein [Candidatus Ranarchaeia archaeon]